MERQKSNVKKIKIITSSLPIPNNLLMGISNHFKLEFIPTAYSIKKLAEVLEFNKLPWNHLTNNENNSIPTQMSIQECKKNLFNSAIIRKNLQFAFHFSIYAKQSDSTLIKLKNNVLYISSNDSSIKIFPLKNDRFFTSCFNENTGGIWAFDSDGEIVVIGSTDKTVKLLKIGNNYTFSLIKTSKIHTSTVRVILVTHKHIISASRDSSIIIYDKLLNPIIHLNNHSSAIRAMDVNDKYLVSGSYDCTVNLYSMENLEFLCRLQSHSHRVYTVKIFRNYVAASGISGEVQISRIDTNETFSYFAHRTLTVFLDFVNIYLISSDVNGKVTKFNYIDRKIVWQFLSNYPIKAQKVKHGIIVIGTINSCDVYNLQNGKFIKRLLDNVIVSKIDIDDENIVVTICKNYSIGIEVFQFSDLITWHTSHHSHSNEVV